MALDVKKEFHVFSLTFTRFATFDVNTRMTLDKKYESFNKVIPMTHSIERNFHECLSNEKIKITHLRKFELVTLFFL